MSRDTVTGLEVKPCPFCGAPASVEEIIQSSSIGNGVMFSVGCDNPNEATCYGYQSLTEFSRRSDAIHEWNKRFPA